MKDLARFAAIPTAKDLRESITKFAIIVGNIIVRYGSGAYQCKYLDRCLGVTSHFKLAPVCGRGFEEFVPHYSTLLLEPQCHLLYFLQTIPVHVIAKYYCVVYLLV